VDLGLSVAVLIFLAEVPPESRQPDVVDKTFTNPNGTGMVSMGLLVCSLWKFSWTQHVMCRVQELCSFKNHFDNMFVAMSLCGKARMTMKNKDIHFGNPILGALNESVFRNDRVQRGM
jgi:hypothetical protein